MLQLLKDPNLTQGFTLADSTTLQPKGMGLSPAWGLTELWSQQSLSGAPMQSSPWSRSFWISRFKTVALFPDGIHLGINGNNEYDHEQQNLLAKPWPHLNVRQRVAAPLDGLQACTFAGSFQLVTQTRNSKAMPGSLTQYHVQITFQNLVTTSPEFGQLFVLTIPLYDSSSANIPGGVEFDISRTPGKPGTGNAIYRLPGVSLVLGQSTPVSVDLLTAARDGLAAVQKVGAMTATTFSELSLGAVLVGFECCNIDVTAVRARSLSITAL